MASGNQKVDEQSGSKQPDDDHGNQQLPPPIWLGWVGQQILCDLTAGDIYEDVPWDRWQLRVYALVEQLWRYDQIREQQQFATLALELIDIMDDPANVPTWQRQPAELTDMWRRYVEDTDLDELTDGPLLPLFSLDGDQSTRFPDFEGALSRVVEGIPAMNCSTITSRDAVRYGALMAGHAGACLKGGNAEQFFRLSQEAAARGWLNEVVVKQLRLAAPPFTLSTGLNATRSLLWDRIREDVVAGFFEAADQEPIELQPDCMTHETIVQLIESLERVRDGKTEPLAPEQGLVRLTQAADIVGVHVDTLRRKIGTRLMFFRSISDRRAQAVRIGPLIEWLDQNPEGNKLPDGGIDRLRAYFESDAYRATRDYQEGRVPDDQLEMLTSRRHDDVEQG